QVRVAAAGHPGMGRQAAGQRAEAVVEDQHPLIGSEPLFMKMGEQVLVGGVERLQGVVRLLGLADQVEAGEGRVENRHENWRVSRKRIRRSLAANRSHVEVRSMTASEEKFTRQRLLAVETLTPSLFTLRTTRDAGFRFQAGQFARLGVRKPSGSLVWRAYSMVSAPHDDFLDFFSVVVPGGEFTSELRRL